MSSTIQHPIEEDYGYAMRAVRRPFNEKFPTIVGIIIGVLQMLLTGTIIGLEGGSVAYNPQIDIIYAGFWCSISFFFAWVSMFAFLFFRKTRRWGLVVAGINFSSIVFAIILIVFDSLFIQNPCACYLATLCNSGTSNSSTNVTNCIGSDGKSRVIKAQLACAVTMLASNIGYIILFITIVALSRVTYRPLAPSYRPTFQPTPSLRSSPSKVLTTPGTQTLTYAPSHRSDQYESSYSPRQTELVYPDQTSYWTPSTPYFTRIETF